MKKPKLIRITTVPVSLKYLIKGQMRFMSENGFEVTMISSEGSEIKDIIKNEGCKHIVFNLTRKITPIKDLKTTYKLYKYLKKEKPQIVHTHTPKAGIIGMLASYFANVPNRLHTVAGLPLLETKGFKRLVLNFVEKLTYFCATKVYPNSFGLKKIIIQNKFSNEKKLKVIANGSSNGIDTSYFDAKLFLEKDKKELRDKFKIKETDFVFIFVGRIVGDKGINELVESFCELAKDNTNIKLLLVGPYEDELDPLKEETKKNINFHKQIISVGFQNDVRPFFAIANALSFPSYREGFPNVVMQAGAMNLPSIVSNINGCNEIIKENKNGYIVPVKETKKLYEAMKRIISNSEMQNHSRDIIKNNYEQSIVWEALLEEYKKL